MSDSQSTPAESIDLDLLRCPEIFLHQSEEQKPSVLYTDSLLCDVLVNPAGVSVMDKGNYELMLCSMCRSSLSHNKVPPLALANQTFLSDVPSELKDLTIIKEAMIARCHSKCWIIQLKEENQDLVVPTTQ